MRVVVDTNVFVSAALKDKSLPALAVHVVEQRGILLKSIATERQLFEVLARPLFCLADFFRHARLVEENTGGGGNGDDRRAYCGVS